MGSGGSGARRLAASLRAALPALALLLGLAGAASVRAGTLVVSPEGQPLSLAQAVAQARDGDVIELLPGDYGDARLVLDNRRLTLRGVGEKKPVLNGGGVAREARALILIRGGEVVIDNLELRGVRSRQGDAAAIRMEGGRLELRRSRVQDNEYGLVALNSAQSEVLIDSSEFGRVPRVEGGLYHLLSVGRIARLEVRGSRFQQGFEGHLIKSRARQTQLLYNIIHDGPRGGASYAIELPSGGEATLIGNVIAQGRESQNLVLVAYGSQDSAWPRNRLLMAHNTLLNYRLLPAWFLRVFSDRLPADTEVVAINNVTAGGGLFSWGAPGRFEGNVAVGFGALRDVDTYAFELAPDASARGRGVDPRQVVPGVDLSPQAEFKWPVGTEPLAPRTRWTPGAFQR